MWLPSFHSQPSTGASPPHRRLDAWNGLKAQLFGHPATRCSVCHADLAPDEFADGMCKDQSACCLRRYSQRCF